METVHKEHVVKSVGEHFQIEDEKEKHRLVEASEAGGGGIVDQLHEPPTHLGSIINISSSTSIFIFHIFILIFILILMSVLCFDLS